MHWKRSTAAWLVTAETALAGTGGLLSLSAEAVLGAIIGAISGGGRGAAKSLRIPVESLVAFRLERPLRVDIADRGFMHKGETITLGSGIGSTGSGHRINQGRRPLT